MNFGNTVAEIRQKYEREREKVGERECMNFGNVITEIPAARSACPSVCDVCSKWDVLKKKTNCSNTIAKIGEEKKICGNCGNTIAEIGEEIKIVIVEIWGGIKKISAPQYFYNIFTINHM